MQIIMTTSAIIWAVSALPYIYGVVRGNVKPKIVSWFTWCLLAFLLTCTAFISGQIMSAIMSSVTVIVTGFVLILALKQGSVKLDKLDMLCMVGVALGIAAWLVLNNPVLAIFVAVAVDIVAFIPTLVHGWKSPQEESFMSYGLATVGAAMGLFAAVLTGSVFSGLVYPLYATVFNGIMIIFLTKQSWLSYFGYIFTFQPKESPVID